MTQSDKTEKHHISGRIVCDPTGANAISMVRIPEGPKTLVAKDERWVPYEPTKMIRKYETMGINAYTEPETNLDSRALRVAFIGLKSFLYSSLEITILAKEGSLVVECGEIEVRSFENKFLVRFCGINDDVLQVLSILSTIQHLDLPGFVKK